MDRQVSVWPVRELLIGLNHGLIPKPWQRATEAECGECPFWAGEFGCV